MLYIRLVRCNITLQGGYTDVHLVLTVDIYSGMSYNFIPPSTKVLHGKAGIKSSSVS